MPRHSSISFRRMKLFLFSRSTIWLVLAVSCCIWIATWMAAKQAERRKQEILNHYAIEANSHGLPKIIVLGDDSGDVASKSSRRKAGTVHLKTRKRDDEQVCRIPKLDINRTEITKFYEPPKPLNCLDGKEENWAHVDSDGKFKISEEAEKLHGEINCSISYLVRVNDDTLRSDEKEDIKTGDLVDKEDFSEVKCTAADGKSWSGLLMTVAPKEDHVQKAMDAAAERDDDWSGLDVFFIGFDSLSQMSFRRNLPNTVKVVEEDLEGVVLDGYNIVGDGTPQAFIPILTGQTEEELPLTRKRFKNANYVDDVYPFVWKNFSDAGYVTLYAEDAAAIGTFTYRLKGFRNQPTDHYARTFFQRAESFYTNVNCIGSEPLHKEYFRYASELMSKYNSSIPKFLLAFHSLLSHDHISRVQIADKDTADLLRKLHDDGLLDKSVVIVMADHGHRFSKIRGTHQGQLEERLPFFSIALPKAFRESERGKTAYKNLKDNKERLTSPFDIYSTLLDIIHWPSENVLSTPGDTSKRSLSLFRPIPKSRTCEQAGIANHWCTCLQWQSAMTDPELYNTSEVLARAVVQAINDFTHKERQLCAPLHLNRLEDAKRLVPDETLLKYKDVKDKDGFVPNLSGNTKASFASYQLSFWTKPGDAHYEATVDYDSTTNSVTVDFTSISHVNKYGDSPHCVIDKNYFLAAYCVCYDKIK